MTEATRALVEIVLLDAAKLSKEESKVVLYTEDDVVVLLSRIRTVPYDNDFELGEFVVRFLDSGHILGSASVLITSKKSGRKVVFSGDLGNSPEPLVAPTEWVGEADYAVVESTYGDRLHEPRNEMKEFADIIGEAQKTDGVVLVPSFSLQRSQEILYIFDQLKKTGKMKNETMVFLDSPMAIKATEIFRKFPQLYSRNLREQVKTDDPFDFPGLVLCDTMEKSKQIRNIKGVKVIVAGSGMMTGGRIIHHAINYLPDPKTQVVFVGYQAEGTLGRKIKDGARTVTVWCCEVMVKAQVRVIESMSAHADQGQLLLWLRKIGGLKAAILSHGEDIPRLTLKEKIHQEMPEVKLMLPVMNEIINLK